jgi:anti-sigma-K factor RskA
VNVKEYIVSGIVESYVLGLASPEEMAEFERMCAAHHEVRLAREAFELQLEQKALSNAIKPPAHLQSKIFAELEVESDKLKANGSTIVSSPEDVERAPVVTMRWWKYATAAAVILLLASGGLNIYYANQVQVYKDRYVAVTTEMADREKNMQNTINTYQESIAIMKDTNMMSIQMEGVAEHPGYMATVLWNRQSKDVYLMVNNLPRPEQGKQYQLWALVNGQPVDAGVLEWDETRPIARMKNIPAAQGFAITLEKAGGAEKPDMDAMHVFRMM